MTTPVRVSGPLGCLDSNGKEVDKVVSQHNLRRAVKIDAGLPDIGPPALNRSSVTGQEFSGELLNVSQTLDRLIVCEVPKVIASNGRRAIQVGVNLHGTSAGQKLQTWWTIDPETLDEFDPELL